MQNGLYHKDIYMPKIKGTPNKEISLRYSNHAIRASQNDRYGGIELPNSINPSNGTLIEVELRDNKVVKRVIRYAYNSTHDLIIVVTIPDYVVKTVWLNCKTDKHNTLKEWKYNKKA